MTRRRNIQHGQKRRIPGRVLLPCVIIVICIPLLIVGLVMFVGVI